MWTYVPTYVDRRPIPLRFFRCFCTQVRSFVDSLQAEKAALEQEKAALVDEAARASARATAAETQVRDVLSPIMGPFVPQTLCVDPSLSHVEVQAAKAEAKLAHAKESFEMDREQLQSEHAQQLHAVQEQLRRSEQAAAALQHQLDRHAQVGLGPAPGPGPGPGSLDDVPAITFDTHPRLTPHPISYLAPPNRLLPRKCRRRTSAWK